MSATATKAKSEKEIIKKRRQALCAEQVALEQTACAMCPMRNENCSKKEKERISCDACLFACSFIEIGNEIKQLTYLKRKESLQNLIDDVRENGFSEDAYETLCDTFESEHEIQLFLEEELGYRKRFFEAWKRVFILKPERFTCINIAVYHDLLEQGYTVREMAIIFKVTTSDLQAWKEAFELTGVTSRVKRSKTDKTRYEIWQERFGGDLNQYLTWVIECKKTFMRESSKNPYWRTLQAPSGKSVFDIFVREIVSVKVRTQAI